RRVRPERRRVCADARRIRGAAEWRRACRANPWEAAMAIIAFNSVSKAYQQKTVLHDFSLVVEPGQRVVILGPSGCGKTTVLRLLAGFIAPDTGTISIDRHVVAAAGKILQSPGETHLDLVFQVLAPWP